MQRMWAGLLVSIFLIGSLAQLVPGLPGPALAGASGNFPTPDSMILHLETPGYTLEKDSQGLDRVQMEGFSSFASPGNPDLPGKIFWVALPPDVIWDSIQVKVLREKTQDIAGQFTLPPASAPSAWVEGTLLSDWGAQAASIVDGRNTNVYGRDVYFPSGSVAGLSKSQMRKWRLGSVLYTPVKYNDRLHKLRLTTEIELKVTFQVSGDAQRPQQLAEMADSALDPEAAALLYNYQEALIWYPDLAAPEAGQDSPVGYAILTTNAIRAGSSQLNAFVNHKRNQGYSVEVVTEDQYGSLTGQAPDGRAEKVRQWLKENYLSKGLTYVLLIGNPDPDDPSLPSDSVGDLPMKMAYPIHEAGKSRETPTDYFYADLSGDWDLDHDQFFGEYSGDQGSGGVDFVPELYVGRIPVYTTVSGWQQTLDSILLKQMAYDNSPDKSWRKSALLPMSFSDAKTDGAWLAELMRKEAANLTGYRLDTLYQHKTTGCNSSFPSTENLTHQSMKNRWVNNDYGLVLWWAHGSPTGAFVGYSGSCDDGSLIENWEAPQLDNAHPAFTFQVSCDNGYPENAANLGYSLLKNGAIGTISASRVSWYSPGSLTPSHYLSDNASLGYYIANGLASGVPAGKALYSEKARSGPGWGDETWMNLMDFNLYGDPTASLSGQSALPDAPSSLTAQEPTPGVLQLSWQDNSRNESGFMLEVSADGLSGWSQAGQVGSNILTFQHTHLGCNAIWHYRVRAFNDSGISAYSNTVRAATSPCALTAPAGLAARRLSSTQIGLSWTDLSRDETGFQIERRLASSSEWLDAGQTPADANTFSDQNLLCSQDYSYRILAYNDTGLSAYSDIESATTGRCPPVAPWREDFEGETDDWQVVGPWHLVQGETSTWTEAPSSGRSFWFGQDASGSYAAEAVVSGTLTSPPVVIPAGMETAYWAFWQRSETGITQDDQRSLQIARDGGPFVDLLRLEGDVGPEWQRVALDLPGYQGSTIQVRYLFNRLAGSETEVRDWYIDDVIIGGYPAAPAGLSASAIFNNQVDLTWTDLSWDETGFRVQRSSNGLDWVDLGTVGSNASGYSDPTAACSSLYTYQVLAYNERGDSTPSNRVEVQTISCAPSAPGGLLAESLSLSAVSLAWSDLSDNEDGFIIERSPHAAGAWSEVGLAGPQVTQYIDQALPGGGIYDYRVRAYSASIFSAYTNVASAALPYGIFLPAVQR